MNSKRVEGTALAPARRAAVNADRAADAADVQGGGRIELAALAPAGRTAVATSARIVRVVMESGRANPTTVAIACGVTVNATIGWGPVKEAHLCKKLIIKQIWFSLSESDHFSELKLII